MRWLLAGCCGLALISISAALNPAITQKPRFYGVITGHSVGIYCLSSEKRPSARAQWYKAQWYKDDVDVQSKKEIVAGRRLQFHDSHLNRNTFLLIREVRIEDSGVYFCKMNNTWGPGTALQVARPINLPLAVYRSKMKDALIILQGLVLAMIIAAFVLRKRQLMDKKDIIYEQPDTDHIYEGLAVETCDGGLYEELTVYAEAEGTEAPWE